MQRVSGFVQQGNTTVVTLGFNSTTVVEGSFPSSTVSVFATGTQNLVTIFSDNSSTPKANPFTAGSDGSFFFYCLNQRVDIQFSGTGIVTPFTIGDVLVSDQAIPNVGVTTIAFSATPTFDLSKNSWFEITLTGNVTGPIFSNASTGSLLFMTIIQDGTGGRTWAWPAAFLNPPAPALGPNVRSDFIFVFDGTNWRHFASGDGADLTSNLAPSNSIGAIATLTLTRPYIGGSGGGGVYPLTESGNLLIVPRGSGAIRDIVLGTGTPPVFNWKFDRSAFFTSLAASAHTWVPSTDLSVAPDTSITRGGVNVVKVGITGGAPDASGTLAAAALNNGGQLILPTSADTLVARATVDTLSNKTFTGASSGNAITLLNAQGSTGALTGNSSDQTIFTFTIPANVIGSGKGIRVKWSETHTSGTASVTYKLTFGSTALVSYSTADVTVQHIGQHEIINATGVQNSQIICNWVLTNITQVQNATTAAENTANPLVVKLTFNVANTDQVTGRFWLIELIQ